MKPVLSLTLAVLLPAAAMAQEKIEAITRPSEDTTLAFVRPGRVAKVLVKEGDEVKKGDELICQDDEAEMAQLEQLKAQAEDNVRVRAAEAQLEQKRVDLRNTEWAYRKGAATSMEVEHAKLEVTIAELSLELSQFEHKQDQLKYREAAVQVQRMRLKSPIDGKVERPIDNTGKSRPIVEVGESVDAQEKIIRIVKIDPLRIDVPVPLEKARKLKRGADAAEVEFDNEGGEPLRVAGAIRHVAAVSDAASGTLTVVVEVRNPAGRPAGERVYVSFPPARTAQRRDSPQPQRPSVRDSRP